MGKRTPKTTGAEWLYLSMASFNGSGYADKSSPEAYVKSYMLYKAWKKKSEAVNLVRKMSLEALGYAEKLVQANEPGHQPTDKNRTAFEAFCARTELLL